MTQGNLRVPFVLRPVAYLGQQQNRYVATAERYSTIGYDDIVAYASRAAHVPESSITMAMDALFDALNYFVCNGHGVQLPNLGTFTFGINAKSQVEESAAGADAVYRTKINFRPVKELMAVLANVAITSEPLNPNGLSENVVSDNLKVRTIVASGPKSPKFFLEQGRAYALTADKASKFTVQLNGPIDGEAYMDVKYRSNFESQIVRLNGTPKGSTIIFDANDLPPVFELEAINMTFFSNLVQTKYRQDYSVDRGYAVLLGVNFMGQAVAVSNYGGVREKVTAQKFVTNVSSNRTLYLTGANLVELRNLGVSFDTGESPVVTKKGDTVVEVSVPANVRVITIKSEYLDVTLMIPVDEEGRLAPHVTSLSANGVTIYNGESSTIEEEKEYRFTLGGVNLDLIKLSAATFAPDIRAKGAVIEIISQESTEVVFDMKHAQTGNFTIMDNKGATLFEVELEAYDPSSTPQIYSVGGVGNGGVISSAPSSGNLLVLGTDNLTPTIKIGNWSITRGSVMGFGSTGHDGEATIDIKSTSRVNNKLRCTVDGSVIFEATIDFVNA